MPLDMTMNSILMFFFLLFSFFISFSNSLPPTTYCPIRGMESVKLDSIKTKNYYECPGGQNPIHYTDCCADNQCCPSYNARFIQIDQNLAFMIALSASVMCLIFSSFLMVCFFCPCCPCYNACRIRYTRDEAGCAHKMGEVPLYYSSMPLESPTGNTVVIAHSLKEKSNGFISYTNHTCKEAAV